MTQAALAQSASTDQWPIVRPERHGNINHHPHSNLQNLTGHSQLVARELFARGYKRMEGQEWRLAVGLQPTGNYESGCVKPTSIGLGRIELKVQPGERDSVRICYLYPPVNLASKIDNIFETLRDLTGDIIAWSEKVSQITGVNILPLIQTSGEDPAMAIKANWQWPHGPSDDDISLFTEFIERDVKDGLIQFSKLDSALARVAKVVQPSQLWLALARYSFVQSELIVANTTGFHLSDSMQEAVEHVRRQRDFELPEEVDRYLRSLMESENEHQRLENQRKELVKQNEESANKEARLTAELKKASDERRALQIRLEQTETSLKSPKLVGHAKVLAGLRRRLHTS